MEIIHAQNYQICAPPLSKKVWKLIICKLFQRDFFDRQLNQLITMGQVSLLAAIVRSWDFYIVSHCIPARPIASRKCFIIGLPGWYKIAILITFLNSLPLAWCRRTHESRHPWTGTLLNADNYFVLLDNEVPVCATFWYYEEVNCLYWCRHCSNFLIIHQVYLKSK